MIDDLHTTLIMLQLHMPIVQKAKHLRGCSKPILNSITNSKRGLSTRGQKLMLRRRHAKRITMYPAWRACFTIHIAERRETKKTR